MSPHVSNKSDNNSDKINMHVRDSLVNFPGEVGESENNALKSVSKSLGIALLLYCGIINANNDRVSASLPPKRISKHE